MQIETSEAKTRNKYIPIKIIKKTLLNYANDNYAHYFENDDSYDKNAYEKKCIKLQHRIKMRCINFSNSFYIIVENSLII